MDYSILSPKLIFKMYKISVSCMLKSLDDVSKIIILPNNKTIYLGRNEDIGICDPMVSRKQVAATADYNTSSVKIETNGINYSGCNGYALRKGSTYHLKHEDCIELLIGRHKFEVIFEPLPEGDEQNYAIEPVFKKKKANYAVFNVAKPTPPTSFDDTSQKSAMWEKIDNGDLWVYTSIGVKAQTKVAAFDLDGTIIKTKSGARFAKDFKDWTLNYSSIPNNLRDLFNDNFKIVIFTNQAGTGTDETKLMQFKTKVEDILSCLNVPVQVFVATTKSIYRKPAPGMWYALCKEKNYGIPIDVSKSFFVGDAAGRAKNWAPKKNKDHSVSDRLFAMNLNIKFYTPEEYFLKSYSVPFVMPKFDPRDLLSGKVPICNNKEHEVIMMVGCPASGKSYYSKKYFPNKSYVHINRDTLGSWQQCVKLLEKSLKNKQSVVVDNTNPDKATRKKYIDIAKENKVPVRCFLMMSTLEHCKHNNKFRSLTDKSHALVGDVILNMYQKQYQEPTLDEGFKEIIRIPFVLDFDDTENEKLYRMFLLES